MSQDKYPYAHAGSFHGGGREGEHQAVYLAQQRQLPDQAVEASEEAPVSVPAFPCSEGVHVLGPTETRYLRLTTCLRGPRSPRLGTARAA